ncbi:DUF917 domain-containing protein [Caldifermentibacillus hisashii]|jgi:hypothetical protein|uniref:DUF917 domain-containing protein n=1 Tax=Caldifermentibacillus hisashii TaxID=996558 RepID=A0ABU9JY08_9BACI|nr:MULTISPECIES: DUF917 domain-containing protein [Bacillaceae]MBU5342725.1 DUF917 domain-containing protein [Caldifermentibacillus hisashii]MCB7069134.1 DUF917 domain-containing protein [Caldibacillus sp. 210928-DFI.2.22]MCB7072503.1 DUF917 domain-containing protein [Caldibacillus sp. 210928-DFI.2.18]MCM3053186.1 DUF917 domain-containing protein [Caldibacillus thermoamylovorans]MCM3797285.1 DUF917 domain-containing protein [Caldibacillus thermoamylovorans]
MRKIGKQEIEDIAVGAALLGTGGGGDPYIGKLMALQAIEEFGPVTVLEPDEVPDDALVVPSSMMGAPTVMLEKLPSGEEAIEAFQKLEEYLGEKVYATFPIEAGGLNSMLPFALAARLRLPVVDADGMGRAFPELQMVTFYLDGISATPAVIADEKGNTALLSTIDNVWTERIARAATIQMGGSVMNAMYSMRGKNLKESGIPNILQLEEEIGKTIRLAKANNVNAIQEVLKTVGGFELFLGKVVDIDRKTESGFARGVATFEGMNDYKDETLQLRFQNEHLIAQTEKQLLCVTPDLIAVLDAETGLPITTEGIRYGARCVVIGIPCHPKWRTEKGIETVGPRYFGYDLDYVPVEELVKRGGQK